MSFIVDAQLPKQLCQVFSELSFIAIHVESLQRGDESTDAEIAAHADSNNLMVVTKDFDFYHSHMTVGRPARLFLITTGNISNAVLFQLLRSNAIRIRRLIENCTFIELSNDGITGH